MVKSNICTFDPSRLIRDLSRYASKGSPCPTRRPTIASDRGVIRKGDTRKGHGVEEIEGKALERGEDAKSSAMVEVRMEVAQSMMTWCSSVYWMCSRQPRLENSCWDHLSQVGVIKNDVENIERTLRSFRDHDDGGY